MIGCPKKTVPTQRFLWFFHVTPATFWVRKNCTAGARFLDTRYHDRHFVKNRIKNHRIIYNEVGNILVLSTKTQKKKSTHGKVAIITAGTADVSVAEEAKTFLESVYVNVITHYDVGVAGIHRLFNSISYVIDEDVDVIIAIAGREGAMPSIIAGLVDKPIIGVPTSNGYGYGEKGISALTSMLQSCSLGIGTVNIDSGIGAAVFAYLICNSLHK